MPGEYYSPTQPFPVKPPPFGRIRFTMDDIATVTPEHTAACRERLMAYDGGRNRGPYTPPSEAGALVFPSTGGGTEFTGGTFDPSLGYYIINYADTGHISTLRRVEDDPDRRSYVGPPESRRVYWHIVDRLTVDGWPCWQPPWSPAGRGRRQHRRDRLEDSVRHGRGRAPGPVDRGTERPEGWSDLDRGWRVLHRRLPRSPVPCL